jgi:hypothetical protein
MITLLFTLRDLTDLGRELSDELSEIQRIRRELSAVHHVGGSE